MTNNEIREKTKETAIKLLDCVERAAELSATPQHMENIQGTVESALKLLDYYHN